MSNFDQESLDHASWELQRHFGREGSLYGIKACEEIARIALTAYGMRPEERATKELLQDALLQLEYLHEKYQPTSTGEAMIARLRIHLGQTPMNSER